MSEAELHSAFFFTCDACGLDTFVRAREAQMDSATAEKIMAGEAVMHFDTVVPDEEAEDCGARYASVLAYDSEDS